MAELTRTDTIADKDLVLIYKLLDGGYRGLEAEDLVSYLDEEVRGDPGPTGPGVPVGGTAGQVLSKVDGTDLNTEWVDPPNDSWGGITGTLSDQADLQDALDAKEPTITKSSGILSWTGSAWAWLTSIAASLITQDSTHRMHTDAQAASWNGKQDALGFTAVPNTRTVAGKALSSEVTLVKADVGLGSVDNTADADKPVSTAQSAAIGLKQDTLVSGTNIKTINGQALTGSGNLVITGVSGPVQVGMEVRESPLVATGEIEGWIDSPIAGTITGWVARSLSGLTTSTVDVWKKALATPTVADKISASAPITLTADDDVSSAVLTGWSGLTVEVGDRFKFNVLSNSASSDLIVGVIITPA